MISGVYEPRRSVDGSPLPSARLVSQSLIPDFDSPDGQLALITMTFAQFTDHDFNLAPVFTTRESICFFPKNYGTFHDSENCPLQPTVAGSSAALKEETFCLKVEDIRVACPLKFRRMTPSTDLWDGVA